MFAFQAQSLLLIAILASSLVDAARLSHKDIRQIRREIVEQGRTANLDSRQGPNKYLTIVRGLLRSHKFIDLAGEIPCNIVQTLESDANAAENFVSQLVKGNVPDLIKDLPQEVIGVFSDVVNIAETLPTEILGAAEAVVTDAANVFNDIENGNIVSDLAKIPSVVVSEVTAEWGGFTSGLVNAWDGATDGIACFFGDCPTPVPSSASCAATATATQQTTATTSSKPNQTLQPGNSAAPTQSSSIGSNTGLGRVQSLVIAILGSLGFLFGLL